MRPKLICLTLVLCFCLGAMPASAGNNIVTLSNKYIAIVVNAREQNTGRFSVNTTGGDPYRLGDENKPLIYGGHNPWTSYTTVQVDRTNFVFGGPTETRAGRSGRYGRVVSPPAVVGNEIHTVCDLDGIQVQQVLGFTKSPTTGLADTARIEYTIKNTSERSRQVGLRIVLDTMLGANDGAPFRVEEAEVLTDRLYRAAQMPAFWQAFDSLGDPQVMAQGTLKGGDVTIPDLAFFTNWGSLADSPWDFDVQPARDFTRKGEFELDSALAVRWEPAFLAPGEERVYVAYYGLGGITIAPGELSLGVTSPASVIAGKKGVEPFPVIAYVENTGTGEARDVVASIEPGEGLRLVSGEMEKELGHLSSKVTAQAKWLLVPTSDTPAELTFTVRVRSSNSEPNFVVRKLTIVAPPKLETSLEGPLGLGVKFERWDPVPFRITARVSNTGGADAYRVRAEFSSPVLGLAGGEGWGKYVGNLGPGEESQVSWSLRPIGFTGHLPYSVKTEAFNVDGVVANNFILVPLLKPRVWVQTPTLAEGSINTGDFFTVDVIATNIPDFFSISLDLVYDTDVLQIVGGPLGIDRGTLFVHKEEGERTQYLEWAPPLVDQAAGVVTLAGNRHPQGPQQRASGTVATMRFLAKRKATNTPISIDNLIVQDVDGNPVKVEAAGTLFDIKDPLQSDN
jgi:hypothetical protein